MPLLYQLTSRATRRKRPVSKVNRTLGALKGVIVPVGPRRRLFPSSAVLVRKLKLEPGEEMSNHHGNFKLGDFGTHWSYFDILHVSFCFFNFLCSSPKSNKIQGWERNNQGIITSKIGYLQQACRPAPQPRKEPGLEVNEPSSPRCLPGSYVSGSG